MNKRLQKEHIESYISDNYPAFIVMCDCLYSTINQSALDLYGLPNKDNEIELNIFSRLMSVAINTKMSLYLLNEFIKKENWVEEYSCKILISNNEETYLNYLKDLDTDYRFLFFTQFFSQIESFAREFNRIKQKKFRKPFSELLTSGENSDLAHICFAEAIRNSIHNNGCFYPYPDHPQKLVYKDIILNYGDNLDFFSWDYAFEFCEILLNHLSNSLKAESH
jgi:hypothetical protein